MTVAGSVAVVIAMWTMGGATATAALSALLLRGILIIDNDVIRTSSSWRYFLLYGNDMMIQDGYVDVD